MNYRDIAALTDALTEFQRGETLVYNTHTGSIDLYREKLVRTETGEWVFEE